MKTPSSKLLPRILLPMAALASLAISAHAAEPLAVEEGLEAAYFANDLPADIPSGREVNEWQEVSLGGAAKGTNTWDGKSLMVTGAGAGLDASGMDQCHFVHIVREDGDFDVIARVTMPEDAEGLSAGIMARENNSSPRAAMSALQMKVTNNVMGWRSRIPAANPRERAEVLHRDTALARREPVWIRMIRMGENFAIYKSGDGKRWVNVSNVSGGPTAITGDYHLGFFVAGGARDKPGTVSFDNISIGEPNLGHRTSWVGNTFGSRTQDHHVSNSMNAMWVAPDGTCYTSSYWDEGARTIASYRDGKVARRVPLGPARSHEGGITGDENHIYVAHTDHIVQLTPAAEGFAPRQIMLSSSLLDGSKKYVHSFVSGLASRGDELFVADSFMNRIRVADTRPQQLLTKSPGSKTAFAIGEVAVPEGLDNAAPAEVYLSQRAGNPVHYTFSGLRPNSHYTIRCHLAAYNDRQPEMTAGSNAGTINVLELAGAAMTAHVLDLPGQQSDREGNLTFTYGGRGGAMCGIEVLDDSGAVASAVNCGGGSIGQFVGESAELADRAFAFERPGPMVIDKRGDLWIVQRGNDFPIGGVPIAKYPAAIKCYKPDGTFTGREITDVVNPRALGYDRNKDELLVAENGPDLNVRIYSGLESAPALARTFGEPGGIYAGANPGLVHDPEAGGYARFAGLSGVGVDDAGNLYVGGGFQGTDLRMFKPDGDLGWMLNSLVFCNTYDVDPDSDGESIRTTYHSVALDLTKTAPGSEQTYHSYNWDLRRFGAPVRQAQSQAILRRLGPERKLVMFTSGQGAIGDINIFRYEGELAIPSGGTRDGGKLLWVDANGDGLEQPEEMSEMHPPIGPGRALAVDTNGDIRVGITQTRGSFMRHFKFQGFNEHGVPLYSGEPGEGWEDVRFPEEGADTSGWGMAVRMDYDLERDILVAMYPAEARQGDADTTTPYFFARYNDWSKGNRTPLWKQKTFDPLTHPEYFMYEVTPFPHRQYMGMQIAGDSVFFAYLFGEVHVFDLETGELAHILPLGPEVAGRGAWEDAAMGLRAFKRSNGEYLIFTENSGLGGKNNLFRWKPELPCLGSKEISDSSDANPTQLMKTPSSKLLPRILPPMAALASLAISAHAAEPLAVEDGLEAAYFANDLPADIPSGGEVNEWPESANRTGPLATAGNQPPEIAGEGLVGSKTKAVVFGTIPPADGLDSEEYEKNMPWLNFPTIQMQGDKWQEITLVVAGVGLEQPGLFSMNPGRTPTFRHYGWVQFTDVTSGAAIRNPIPPEFRNMPVVYAVTVSRTPSSNAVLTAYVNGEETGSQEQEPRSGAQNPMEPFEGVVIAEPRPLFSGDPDVLGDVSLARGANIGAGPDQSGRKEQIAVAAVLLYSRALTADEVTTLSESLLSRLGM